MIKSQDEGSGKKGDTTRKRAIDGIDTNGAPDKRCAISIY